MLVDLEKRYEEEEDRFSEMELNLGRQYCADLIPSAVGFDRCIYYLLLDQTMVPVIVVILLIIHNPIHQLLCILVLQHVYYLIQLIRLKAVNR